MTALITRETPAGRELLVFQHPTAGVQLPAGTIEPGETPQAAVLREVAEETSLTTVEIVRYLGMMTMEEHDIPLEPDERLMLRSMPRMRYPGEPDVPRWRVVRRGERVRLQDVQGAFARVTQYRYQLGAGGTLDIIRCASGWVEAAALTRRLERHLFHLRLTAPTPNAWEIHSDHQHRFRLYWVPLDSDPGLVIGQRRWLEWAKARHL